jgi:4-amino-4-deoxy-L-arabinose transferase-like glycosyltransferase
MSDKRLPIIFALLTVVLHLLTAQTLGFHRDELLYLALGRHLDWGYWSNPPLIGWISWITQHTLGDSLPATRFIPAVCGGALTWLTLRMAQEMGGGRWAVILAGVGMFGSMVWLRAFSMLQPVPFDIFFWTLTTFLLLKWVNTRDDRWWWAIGVSIGLGMLNKYMIFF